jgi:uncharacterized OB-fold protein
MMVDVRVIDAQENSSGDLRVVVYGNPQALLFKDRQYSTLVANICGDCGHVELRATNPEALYDKYLAAKGVKNPDAEERDPEAIAKSLDSDEEASSADRRWQCRRCGEKVESNFDFCWKCGAQKS